MHKILKTSFLVVISFLLFISNTSLNASLSFETNSQKEMELLKSFDINPSFLNDHVLIRIKSKKLEKYKKERFFKAMDEAYLYIPMIKQLLSESEVPVEFLFLAMAESNFSTRAFSRKKASGLWQFMPYTGKRYGLKINEYVDERRDLVKSTKAAITYLTVLHKRFGKWYLAALAYNCGEGRVQKAIKRAGSDDLDVLLDPKKRYLPRESRFYIRKIIALALIGSDESFLIDSEYDYLLNRANAYSIVTVSVQAGESLSRISKILEIPEYDLIKLNRHLNYKFTPPYSNKYDIYIPYIKLSEFKKNYRPGDMSKIYVVHKVKRGDNLSKLGQRYHISYKVIKDVNNLKSNTLHLRQKLIIPIPKGSYYAIEIHKVRSGDTLGGIAKRYKVTIADIKRLNKISGNIIRIGDKLTIHD
jgi:membrane-bound lytic murein transglycosylase D